MCGGVHSTRPSEGAELKGRGPWKCTVRGRGRSRVLYGSGRVCGGVHNTRPSGGGLSYRGEARGSVL